MKNLQSLRHITGLEGFRILKHTDMCRNPQCDTPNCCWVIVMRYCLDNMEELDPEGIAQRLHAYYENWKVKNPTWNVAKSRLERVNEIASVVVTAFEAGDGIGSI